MDPFFVTLLLLILLVLSPGSKADTCTDYLGSLASCKDTSLCVSSGGVAQGSATGKCPGASNIKCCTNFLLTSAFSIYNPVASPWHKTALDNLQARLINFQEFRTFACKFRNKTPDGTYCGGEDGMTIILLSNVAQYYDSSLTYQVGALNYIQGVMVGSSALLNDWLAFVRTFRNLNVEATTGFLPATPNWSGNQGQCTTPYNGFQGYCIPVSACTGATFNGLCPGSSKCCVAETRPANPSSPRISFSTFTSLFEGISTTRATAFWPYFNEALDSILADKPSSTTTCHRIAAFAAQVGHESAGLLYFEELASGSAYNGRCSDLGNCQPNDGPRFKGRGPIQLTGRANYRRAGASLNMDLEVRPEQACFPSAGFKTTVWFWMSHNLNNYCTGNYNDFTALTKKINGGTNGIDDRRSRWAKAKSLLGCAQGLEVTSPSASYVLQLAGLAGNDTNQTDLTAFADSFCPQNYQLQQQELTPGILVAIVVPCAIAVIAFVGIAAFFIVKSRKSAMV